MLRPPGSHSWAPMAERQPDTAMEVELAALRDKYHGLELQLSVAAEEVSKLRRQVTGLTERLAEYEGEDFRKMVDGRLLWLLDTAREDLAWRMRTGTAEGSKGKGPGATGLWPWANKGKGKMGKSGLCPASVPARICEEEEEGLEAEEQRGPPPPYRPSAGPLEGTLPV
jgi:hypothetical protein